MNEQRDRAKADAKAKKSGHTDLTEYRSVIDKFGSSKFVGYKETSSEGKITALLIDGAQIGEANVGTDVEICLNQSPFYAEGGGQLADNGTIKLGNGALIKVDDVQSPVPG